MKNIIPDNVMRVLSTLTDAGYEAYLVGGCVRDAALGKEPHDFDATTSALPEEMLRVFADFRVIETGLKHGTLTVMSEGEPVEVTTYRVDGEYLDNRHPAEVRFTRSITEDLSRRDFTVNAMAYSPTQGLCDPFCGMEHLAKGRLVCVGSPEERFGEDGLRILRALRFASVLDFEIDPATAAAVKSMKHLLGGISGERVFSELKKLLCGDGAAKILSGYPEVIADCIPGVEKETLSRSGTVTELPRDAIVRLAYIFRDAPCAALPALQSLKASNAELKRCVRLAEAAKKRYPTTPADIRRLMGSLEDEDIRAYAALRWAETGESEAAEAFLVAYSKESAQNPCVKISELAINGKDIMELTGVRGKKIGELLSALLEAVIEERVPNDKEKLREYVRARVSE